MPATIFIGSIGDNTYGSRDRPASGDVDARKYRTSENDLLIVS
jgi:hypothetical protein